MPPKHRISIKILQPYPKDDTNSLTSEFGSRHRHLPSEMNLHGSISLLLVDDQNATTSGSTHTGETHACLAYCSRLIWRCCLMVREEVTRMTQAIAALWFQKYSAYQFENGSLQQLLQLHPSLWVLTAEAGTRWLMDGKVLVMTIIENLDFS